MEERVPSSIKNPLSATADYANPKIYGWASIVVGVLAVLVGLSMLFVMPGAAYPLSLLIGLGGVLLLVGRWMVRRVE